MSRVENSADAWDGDEYMPYGLWEGAYDRAMNGPTGLRRLEEMLAALEALPEQKLCASTIANGQTTCFVGAFVAAREAKASGKPIADVITEMHERALAEYGDGEDSWEDLSTTQEVAMQYMPMTVAWEWAQINDSDWLRLSDEERWATAHGWVSKKIAEHPARKAT
jgi:hypothetical protein